MTEKAAIDDLRYLIEEYSAYPPETGVYSTIGALNFAIQSLEEIQQYREIGTVEECREAREKQKSKKCVIDSCPDHTHYECPSCGKIHLSRYKHGCSSLGRIPRYCEYCGQAIDENLEERKE